MKPKLKDFLRLPMFKHMRFHSGLPAMASWTQPGKTDESIAFITDLALSHALEGGQQGAAIASLIKSGNYPALCDYELDYQNISAHAAGNCRQALAFFSKNRYIDLNVDVKAVAFSKFMAAEERCRQTNELFREYEAGRLSIDSRASTILHRAAQKISRVLGPVPSLPDLHLRFGPGATTLTKKKNASVVEKLQAGHSCSEDLLPILVKVLEEMPAFRHVDWVFLREDSGDYDVGHVSVCVTNGRVDFVRKDASGDRTIVVEPSLNGMVQNALNDYMYERLLRVGIDLRNQNLNKELARVGSITGDLVTLDLKSASDMEAIRLVSHLLPFDWFHLLNMARSSKVDLPSGHELVLEKFSSMGNGFTFPLESLIFWALSSSVHDDGWASVYGDDIIVKTQDFEDVKYILEFCGFTLNLKKSYWSGPFRESCGGDFLSGIDIRPYYHKKVMSGMELFKLHNFYRRRLDFERAEYVRKHIHPSLRIYGPDGYGDGHLLGDWLRRPHKKRSTHGYGGVIFDTFSLTGRVDARQKRPGDRVLPFYSIYTREGEDSVSLADRKIRKAPLSFEAVNYKFLDFSRVFGYNPTADWAADVPDALRERVSEADGVSYKVTSLPGTSGYKRISIYTFNTSR